MKLKSVKIILILFITHCSLQIVYPQVSQAWVSRYNYFGLEGQEVAFDIAVDNSENVFVTGLSHGNSIGYYATVKYSPKGEQLWAARRQIGVGAIFNKIAIDQKSNVIVILSIFGNNGNDECTTIKYNGRNGSVIWERNFHDPQTPYSSPFSVTIDHNNNIYVTGFGGTIKYNSSGIEQWHSTINPMKSIAVDHNLNVYVTGGDQNFKTVKYNNNGSVLWEFNLGGTGNSIALDDSNNVYVVGYNSTYRYSIAKFSTQGNIRWFKNYPLPVSSDEFVPKIVVDKQRNVIVCGNYVNSNSTQDYLVIKYSSNGTMLWDRKYNGPANDYDWARSIALDRNDDIYVTGVSIGDSNLQEMTTVKYSTTGDLKWVKRYVNGAPSQAYGISIHNFNVFITGTGDGGGLNGDDYVTIKYSQVIGIEPISNNIPNNFFLHQNYPNPFNPVTKIRFDLPALKLREAGIPVRLIIYDILGREIAILVNEPLKPGIYEVEFDGSGFASGVYFYKLISGDFIESKKMILIR